MHNFELNNANDISQTKYSKHILITAYVIYLVVVCIIITITIIIIIIVIIIIITIPKEFGGLVDGLGWAADIYCVK